MSGTKSVAPRAGGAMLSGGAIVLLVCAALLILVPVLAGDFTVSLIARGLIYAIVAMSFTFLAGYVGLLSLTQIAFFGMSGYTLAVTIENYGWSMWPAIVAAIVFTVIFGWLFGYIARNASWLYFLMMGLAMVQVIFNIALQATDLTGGHDGLQKLPPLQIGDTAIMSHGDTLSLWYYIVAAFFVLVYFFFRRVTRSPFGVALQGVRDNAKRMAALGYNVPMLKHLAIVLASLVASIGGVLWVFHYQAMSPNSVELGAAVIILFICLLGGTSRIEGGILGAVVYVLIDHFGRDWTGMYETVLGAFFVLVIIFLPDGLISLGDRLKKARGGSSKGTQQPVATATGGTK